MEFAPAVFESFGPQGPASLKLFDKLVARVPRSSFKPPNWAATTPRAFWRQCFAVRLQHYNAYIIQRLAFACRRKQR